MKNIEAVPAILDDAKCERGFRRHRQHRSTIGTVERALADDEHRLLLVGGRMIDEFCEAFRAGAEIIIGISKIDLLTDQPDQHAALEVALADAGIEYRR